METIGFPISREAACCGIYIYLGTTRVGMKSKEDLRSDYLRMYEDNYKSGWEKRRKKMLEQRASAEEIPSPASTNNIATANSFLSMVSSLPKAPSKPEIVIDLELTPFNIGATWEEPVYEVQKPIVKKPDVEWVSNGIELFSVRVAQPEVIEKSKVSTVIDWEEPEDDVDWNDPEDFWAEPESEEPSVLDTPEELPKKKQETISKSHEIRSSAVENPVNHSQNVTHVSESGSKTVVTATFTPTRLDENEIRDFVKSHKLCSEQDIVSAFSDHDRLKVRNVIKSALRKYKIFEKHGKFTV